ncbi:hypothetical protein phiFa_461 [Thermus phage phiFa]|nr:hypothetical protein phiFa_46 [Thermus phage phiFa]QKE11352.1 hypothetical protein phiFa_461 [Thermus phage phiFa]
MLKLWLKGLAVGVRGKRPPVHPAMHAGWRLGSTPRRLYLGLRNRIRWALRPPGEAEG